MRTLWTKAFIMLISALLFVLAGQVYSADYEEVIYYHNDVLGSPIIATDQNGEVLWREEYTPYGSRLTHEARETDCSGPTCVPIESQWDEKVWFTGKVEETRLGLNYFGARWYDPELGRFISQDPVGFKEDNIFSFNRYAYANNNPYKYIDPDGREVRSVGTEAQIKAFNEALGRIRQSNSTTAAQLKALEKSPNLHTLRFPKPGEKPVNKTTGVRANESNGKGTGSESIVDPTRHIRIKDQDGNSVLLSPESVIVHELLGHSGDKDRGIIDRSINPMTGQKRSEESAMGRANTYRRSVRETERKKY